MRPLAFLPLVLVLAVPDAASAASCETKEVVVPGPSRVDARLDGEAGDWDLTVRDAAGREVAAGASPDAQEVASGYVTRAGTLTVRACGGTGDAAISVTHTPVTLTTEKPELVSVETPTRADKNRLVALGLDMSEHGGATSLGVVIHDAADREALRGFTYHAVQAAPETAAAEPALPSGRTSYRRLADYESELKALAAANPGFVRLFVLPNRTFEGREVLGIEIAQDVTAQDGRPAFLNMGVHHAREWPAGELTMEWAYELINGYKAGDARATNIVSRSRNLVVPIVNPDGFNGSRSAALGDDGRDETVPDELYIATAPGEYRRKNCRVGDTETAFCPISVGLAENGVDPNRNYGGFWGGPGSDSNPLTQTYRGPAPFSEPESRNIQWLVSHNQVTTLITNHTTAGLVLRAPGLAALGDPVDEHRGYKRLGDDMAAQNGYFSQKGFELYDTTGTTEDWSYNATGGFGFTFEMYCGAPNRETGDCDAPAFHPRYATMAAEWDGSSAQARAVGGKGNREAFYIAAESTLDEARHAIIEGSAPAGTTLKLTKDFKTAAYDPSISVDDHLSSTLVVGESGTFRWHVNPSTRPIVASHGGTESYTLTCGGASQPVVVERGATVHVDACPGAASAAAAGSDAPAGAADAACAATPSLGVRGGRTLRIDAPGPVSILQQSVGRRIVSGRLVAKLSTVYDWGKRVPDGYYVVRSGERQIAVRHAGGRFIRVADFDRGPACRLSAPVFGGTSGRVLRISAPATVLRGRKVIKRNATTLSPRGLERGTYIVRIGTADLVSRRL